MHLSAPRAPLLDALRHATGVIDARTSIPILGHALLTATFDRLTIQATDHEIALSYSLGAEVTTPGRATVPAAKLHPLLRAMTEDNVTLKLRGGVVEVTAGAGRYKLHALDAQEFPELPTPPKAAAATVEADALLAMLSRTACAMSHDETRMSLCGIQVAILDGALRIVATDGHRLAIETREVVGATEQPPVIVPRKAVGEMRRLLDGRGDSYTTLAVKDGSLHATVGDVSLSVRLFESEYPDYTQVIPDDTPHRVTIAVADLLPALRRVSVVSGERSKGVALDIGSDAIALSTINPDVGEAEESIEVDYAGPPVRVGFNARYLVEALSALSICDTVELALRDDVSPMMMRSAEEAGWQGLIMPMRL